MAGPLEAGPVLTWLEPALTGRRFSRHDEAHSLTLCSCFLTNHRYLQLSLYHYAVRAWSIPQKRLRVIQHYAPSRVHSQNECRRESIPESTFEAPESALLGRSALEAEEARGHKTHSGFYCGRCKSYVASYKWFGNIPLQRKRNFTFYSNMYLIP